VLNYGSFRIVWFSISLTNYGSMSVEAESIGMKYVKFWEVPVEKRDEAIAKWGKYLETSKVAPEKYPRYIFPPHGVGEELVGISVMEADDEDQLINYLLELSPPFKIRFEPLIDSSKYVEFYLKTKK